jgi:hypothetical protein
MKELYNRGRRNPEPTNYEYEATVAEIERRPFCDIRTHRLVLREN